MEEKESAGIADGEDGEGDEEDEEDETAANEEEERIYYAITGEDTMTMNNMLQEGFDPNTKFYGSNQLDKTPLHLCCETGNYDCAKMLLDWGAKKDVLDAWLQTPLVYSISSERINMVQLMLSYGANPNLKDRFGKTSVHFSVNNSDSVILQCLLEKGGADPNIKDDNGRAPLWEAVSEDGHRDHVEALIKSGCDVNLKDSREKRTPLQIALLKSNRDAMCYVRLLLAAGAVCNTVDQFGHSSMMSLIRRNRRKDKEYVQEEDLRMARLLLQHRYNVDLVSRGTHWYQFRGTALKMAADRGAVPIVKLLLESGADPDITDDKNVSPLLLAAMNNYFDVSRLLLQYNCRTDTVGEMKLERTTLTLTPFRCALLCGHVEVARLLVLAGYTLGRESFLWDDTEQVPDVLLQDGDLWIWLQEQARVPWCLAIQSRMRIRQLLGKPFHSRLDQLPLPRWTKHYIAMKDLLTIAPAPTSTTVTASSTMTTTTTALPATSV